MKVWKRALAALLAAGLLATGLSACNKAEEPTAIEKVSGLAPETTMFTVDGQPVTAADYCYWLTYNMDYVSAYIYSGEEPVWTDDAVDGMTVEEYVRNVSMETAKTYRVVTNKAAEYGCVLSEEEEAELDAQMTEMVSNYGENEWTAALEAGTVSEEMTEEEKAAWKAENGQIAFDNALDAQTVGSTELRSIAGIYKLYSQTLPEKLFASDGPYPVTAETFQAWAEENGYYSFKHILLSTRDDANQPLDDASKVEIRARLQAILDEIRSSADPAAAFDTAMHQNSEDTGLAYYPDGYFAAPGEMVVPVETAAQALATGEISEIVESDFGYHIILRIENIDSEENRALYQNKLYEELFEQWVDEAQVEETEALTNLDLSAYFTNLTALRKELYPEDAAEPSETGTPETPAPTATPAAE